MSRPKQRKYYVLLCALCTIVVLKLSTDKDIPQANKVSRKLILGWTNFVGQQYNGKSWMRHCPEFECDISGNRSQLAIADAVVFHMGEINWNDLPTVRQSHQRFVFHNLESPISVKIPTENRMDFNWTMTFRRDSDIYNPYGVVRKSKNEQFNRAELLEIAKNKQFPAVSIISNCHTTSKRGQILQQLAEVVEIHKFGACGDRKCDFTNRTCVSDIGKKYRFYMSFENSLCKDYVTEKLFLRLLEPIVPVVLERKNYETLLPPKSFISLDDFASPKELGKFLMYLGSNTTAYLEYLEWRKDFVVDQFDEVETSANHGFCALCTALHNTQLPPKSVPNMYNWWVKEANCKN